MKLKSGTTKNKRPTKSESQDSAEPADFLKSTGPSPPANAAQWHDHEHQADAAQLQAKKLIEETGSPDLAKHAVEMAAHTAPPSADVDAHARQFGFESYEVLCGASLPLRSAAGEAWRVADLGNGRWLAWNKDTWPEHQMFDTYEHAQQALQGGSGGTA